MQSHKVKDVYASCLVNHSPHCFGHFTWTLNVEINREVGLWKRDPRIFCVRAMSACTIDVGVVRAMSEGLFSGLETSLYWSRVLVTGLKVSFLAWISFER